MPVTRDNLLAHEWIGLHVTVDSCPDPSLRNLSGLVRDETRNTLVIESQGSRKVVPKLHAKLTATLPTGETSNVDGGSVRHRPEDRIKKGLKKW